MYTVSRNPFARTEVVRFSVNVSPNGTCDWCGRTRLSKTGRNTLFRYATQSDGGRENVHTGQFCSKSCHDCYHG